MSALSRGVADNEYRIYSVAQEDGSSFDSRVHEPAGRMIEEPEKTRTSRRYTNESRNLADVRSRTRTTGQGKSARNMRRLKRFPYSPGARSTLNAAVRFRGCRDIVYYVTFVRDKGPRARSARLALSVAVRFSSFVCPARRTRGALFRLGGISRLFTGKTPGRNEPTDRERSSGNRTVVFNVEHVAGSTPSSERL